MTIDLFPYQVDGADFLAKKGRALLADAMRVGKTAAAIRAADLVGAEDILWLTKGTARRGHARAWKEFQRIPRRITPVYSGGDDIPHRGVLVTSYDLAVGPLFDWLRIRGFDAIVIDESHRLKNRKARRTVAVYGEKSDGDGGLIQGVDFVWPLSGTPAPKNYGEIWTTMRALFPESLSRSRDTERGTTPMSYSAFTQRYCKFENRGYGPEIVGNKNADELRQRLAPHMLRRTLKDVRQDHPPILFDTLELDAADNLAELKDMERTELLKGLAHRLDLAKTDEERENILDAVDAKVKSRLRRLTGLAKVVPMAEWVKEQFDDGMQKLVLFAWHRDVIEGLREQINDRGISTSVIYGGMSPAAQNAAQDAFQTGSAQVAIGQIEAAGEAIDWSVADEVVLVEAAYVPGPNNQAAHRVVNVEKCVSTLARFATLSGTVDERIQRVLMQRTKDISKLFNN